MSNVPILPGTIRNQGRQSANTIICRRKAAEKGEIRSTDSFTATILRPHIRLMRTTAIQSAAEKPAADALLRSFMPQFASADHTALSRIQCGEAMNSPRSEEHTSELQSLMRISYAVFCLKKKKKIRHDKNIKEHTTYL